MKDVQFRTINSLEYLRLQSPERGLLIGYYGVGNFGDELLLELFQSYCHQIGIQELTIFYLNDQFRDFHLDFGYRVVAHRHLGAMAKAFVQSKHLIVGGGGLWGLDTNWKILMLSVAMLVGRLLGKRIHLVGVGYYRSTGKVGHLAAIISSLAAHSIIARDIESAENFFRFTPKKIYLDQDFSQYLPEIVNDSEISEVIDPQLIALNDRIKNIDKVLLIGFRQLRQNHEYDRIIEELLKSVEGHPIVLCLFNPTRLNPDQTAIIERLVQENANYTAYHYFGNPVALYRLIKKYRDRIALIAPQYHAIAIAHACGVRFYPLAYDNKVAELLRTFGIRDFDRVDKPDLKKLVAFARAHFAK